MSRRRNLSFYLWFIGPAALIYLVFFIYPVLKTIHISLYRWSGLSPTMEWVGINNFRELLFRDPVFLKAVFNNLYYLVFFPTVTLFLALLFAAMLNNWKGRWADFLSSAFFFPALISWVAISILWSFIYNPEMGILNRLLMSVGLEQWARPWLGDPAVVKEAVLNPLVWRNVGFYMVIFLAAMRNIPKDYYDAALIDGASQATIFWRITLPLIWEVVTVGVVFMIINSLLLFDAIWIMTEGGPARHTEVVATYFYRKAFLEYEMGYATATAVVLLIAVFVITTLVRRLARRDVVQY